MTSPRAGSPTEPADRADAIAGAHAAGFALALLAFPAAASAGDVRIVDAAASCEARTCRFDVTLEHADTGWDHYADRWQVLAPDGTVLGTRALAHPHVDEQPFTRSLGGVDIPPDIAAVTITARDSIHGVSPHTFTLELELP